MFVKFTKMRLLLSCVSTNLRPSSSSARVIIFVVEWGAERWECGMWLR